MRPRALSEIPSLAHLATQKLPANACLDRVINSFVGGGERQRLRTSRAAGVLAVLGLFCAVLDPAPSRAGSTGANLLIVTGPSTSAASGDYVSTVLGAEYEFVVEVPVGTTALNIQVFDPDIFAANDVVSGGLNTATRYRVIDPVGTTVFDVTCNATGNCNGFNGVWANIPGLVAAPGNWRVLIGTQTTPAGNDINGFGLRAFDGPGNQGGGGVEINVFADTFAGTGVLGAGVSATIPFFPYATNGCSFSSNDFDADDGGNQGGSMTLTSRSGAFSTTIGSLSGNDVWQSNPIAGWTTDQQAVDFGIWSQTVEVLSPAGFAGNIIDLYTGSAFASPPPPTAQPEPDALRLYLPTDLGGAPLKPYLEQEVTWVSGPNPPLAGQTTRASVTVRLTNPTPHSITVGSGRAVVPGNGTVYAGNSQATAGTSVTSEPGLGGVGAVTWDIGTVAAGATVILAYQVDVTPAATGQRVPVTGATDLSNGTLARYDDETGTSFQVGPLCQLAITEALAFYALIDELRIRKHPDGILLRWSTTAEIGTAAFHVLRSSDGEHFTLIEGGVVPSVHTSGGGGSYAVVDDSKQAQDALAYQLIEVDAHGRQHILATEWIDWSGLQTDTDVASVGVAAHRPTRSSVDLDPPNEPNATFAIRSKSTFVDALKIAVTEEGVVAVGAGAIADRFGVAQAEIEADLLAGSVSLRLDGREIPWTVSASGSELLFFAPRAASIFAAEQIYWLRRDPGATMQIRSPKPSVGTPTNPHFEASERFEVDSFMATVFSPSPTSDYWFWAALSTTASSAEPTLLPFEIEGLADSGLEASLTLALQGANTQDVPAEHTVHVELNGVLVGTLAFEGIKPYETTLSIPAGTLQPMQNELALVGELPQGALQSFVYVDGWTLRYQRTYDSGGAAIVVHTEPDEEVAITGVPAEEVLVFDITNPLSPVEVSAVQEADTGPSTVVRFVGDSNAERHWIAPASSWLTPSALFADDPSDLRNPDNGADHLIVTTGGLAGEAERLALWRREQGLGSRVVLVEDIYDEFNHGQSSPFAVADFLRHAVGAWQLPPRYVVFAGAASLDYRNLGGHGDSLVPTLAVQASDGLFGTDAPFADLDGDLRPDVRVGRLPALNAVELKGVIDRIVAYESSSEAEWRRTAIFAADLQDGAADFAGLSTTASRLTPSHFRAQRIHRDDLADGGARAWLEALQGGAVFAGYIGHGGLDRLAASGFFDIADLDGLTNGPRAPIFSALTCSIGRFALSGFESLAEAMVMHPDGGAIAVWSPSGTSQVGHASELGSMLIGRLFDEEVDRLGDAIQQTQIQFANRNGDPHHLQIYSLMGDPALVIQKGARPSNPSGLDEPNEPRAEDVTTWTEIPENAEVLDFGPAGSPSPEEEGSAGCAATGGPSSEGAVLWILLLGALLLVTRRSSPRRSQA